MRHSRTSTIDSKGVISTLSRSAVNLRAVQLLLGHTDIESTVRYLGIDVDDAVVIAEQVET